MPELGPPGVEHTETRTIQIQTRHYTTLIMARKSLLSLALLLQAVSGFYIPGWSQRSYKDGEPIPLSTNKLTSDNTQLPFAYHEQGFVCRAHPGGFGSTFGSSRAIALNLGEVLRGDRIEVSDYELRMGQDEPCKTLCKRDVNAADLALAYEMIKDGYTVEWYGGDFCRVHGSTNDV